MEAKVESTKAKVSDPQKVREILDSYDLRGAEIKLQKDKDGWVLEVAFEGDSDNDDESLDWWPSPAALHRDHWPKEEEYPDEDALFDEWARRIGEQGDEGFLALLRDLGNALETPLLILAADHDFEDSSAKVWRVQPGNEKVETLHIRHW